jgi:CO/xanthine dehydrogenase FAD-binding subunit
MQLFYLGHCINRIFYIQSLLQWHYKSTSTEITEKHPQQLLWEIIIPKRPANTCFFHKGEKNKEQNKNKTSSVIINKQWPCLKLI